ncbi:hypothetical protein ACP6PL_10300 [Dapis sp. BLCC M126]|uniref:hypothetical protein n=1 Tax=Dapis sp. BLCC M126 TaxID=3400189 RepID=UPI003CF308C3
MSDRPPLTNSTNISESLTSLEKNRRSHYPSLLLISLVNSYKAFSDLIYIKLGYLPLLASTSIQAGIKSIKNLISCYFKS